MTALEPYDAGAANAVRTMGLRDGRYRLAPFPVRPQYRGDYDAAYALGRLEADGILTVDDPASEPPTLCGGCAGSGIIRNPNNGRDEPHHACGGRGVR